MNRTISAVLFATLAASAWAAPTAPALSTVTRLGLSTTTFSCTTSGAGDCHYLILNSLCQEKLLAGGGKERSCHYTQAVPPFALKSGERRTVANLAADYLYAMKVGSAPTPEEVVRSPVPH